jgi:hypothetical protein
MAQFELFKDSDFEELLGLMKEESTEWEMCNDGEVRGRKCVLFFILNNRVV